MNILKRILPQRASETAAQAVQSAPQSTSAAQKDRVEAARPSPLATNNYIIVVLDSCRYDSFMAAAPPTLSRLGPIERR